MTGRRHLALLAVLVGAIGCEPRLALGGGCGRNSDCSVDLVCRVGRCRTECHAHRDCPIGGVCYVAPSALGGACRLPDETRCASDAECPPGTTCATRCRQTCVTSADCLGTACQHRAASSYCDDPPADTWPEVDASLEPDLDGGRLLPYDGLVVNEVDLAAAVGERFVEVLNGTGRTVDLGRVWLDVNCRDAPAAMFLTAYHWQFDPGDALPPGYRLVFRDYPLLFAADGTEVPGVLLGRGAGDLDSAAGACQVAVLDLATDDSTDRMTIGGDPSLLPYGEGALLTLVDDAAVPGRAIARIPDGRDTNDNASDFALTDRATPGLANQR